MDATDRMVEVFVNQIGAAELVTEKEIVGTKKANNVPSEEDLEKADKKKAEKKKAEKPDNKADNNAPEDKAAEKKKGFFNRGK